MKFPVLSTGSVLYDDINYYVTYDVYEYRLEVTVYTAFCYGGEVSYRNKEDFGHPTDDVSKAESFLNGHIKWDGCSNWSFHTDKCMAHFCERDELVAVGTLMSRLWDLAKEKVPKWSN